MKVAIAIMFLFWEISVALGNEQNIDTDFDSLIQGLGDACTGSVDKEVEKNLRLNSEHGTLLDLSWDEQRVHIVNIILKNCLLNSSNFLAKSKYSLIDQIILSDKYGMELSLIHI